MYNAYKKETFKNYQNTLDCSKYPNVYLIRDAIFYFSKLKLQISILYFLKGFQNIRIFN